MFDWTFDKNHKDYHTRISHGDVSGSMFVDSDMVSVSLSTPNDESMGSFARVVPTKDLERRIKELGDKLVFDECKDIGDMGMLVMNVFHDLKEQEDQAESELTSDS